MITPTQKAVRDFEEVLSSTLRVYVKQYWMKKEDAHELVTDLGSALDMKGYAFNAKRVLKGVFGKREVTNADA